MKFDKDAKTNGFESVKLSVKYLPLINYEEVILVPLRLKLCFMKNFVKTMDKNGEGFL